MMEYLKSTNSSNMKWSQWNVQKLSRSTKLWHHKNDYKQFKWQKAKQQNLHKTHTQYHSSQLKLFIEPFADVCEWPTDFFEMSPWRCFS